MSGTDFVPRWASPPGDTIKDAIAEQSLDPRSLAWELELPADKFDAFLEGDIPLTIILAERLVSTVGGSIEFWMTRDGQFRADRSRVVADRWVQQMPIREMRTFGWIPPDVEDWVEQIEVCLRFFGVASLEDWEADHEARIKRAQFRTSPTVQTDRFAVAAWLRQCDVELSQIRCRRWDRDGFAALLPQLLPLTREPDPRQFTAALQARCAEVGVAVGVVRAPRGCPVSGAARKLSNGQPSIALSARHLTDDHLWFTFFHEAAHLLLHGTDELYLDEIERGSSPSSGQEAEADDFAGYVLVPAEYEARLARATQSAFGLRSVASDIGVGLGALVGHLQHRGLLSYRTRFNRLKNRFKWEGSTLGKA